MVAQANPQPPAPVHPADVNALIATVQQEFPNTHIRVTGRGRTGSETIPLQLHRKQLALLSISLTELSNAAPW